MAVIRSVQEGWICRMRAAKWRLSSGGLGDLIVDCVVVFMIMREMILL